MIDRIAKIILTTQFKPGDKDDPESCARVIAGAIVDDMEEHVYDLDCSQCDTDACNNPDCFKAITIKGYRVTE